MKKKEKTDKPKAEVTDTTEEYNPPIYLNLNGNGWRENAVYLTMALYDSRLYNRPLYVNSNVGGVNDPPKCPPGFPQCV